MTVKTKDADNINVSLSPAYATKIKKIVQGNLEEAASLPVVADPLVPPQKNRSTVFAQW